MIGRAKGAVAPLDVAKWAREMAAPAAERRRFKLKDGRYYRAMDDPRAPDGLRLLDAHVLSLLAMYADSDGEAYPSIKLLAERCGLKVVRKLRPDGSPAGFTNSAVSASLGRLHDEGLIWNRGRTHGRKGLRELLFDPSAYAEDKTPSSSAYAEDWSSASAEGKDQKEGATVVEGPEQERPDDDLRQGGGRLSPSSRTDDDNNSITDEQERARLHRLLRAAGFQPPSEEAA